MLGALIVSLVPVQFAQANDAQRMKGLLHVITGFSAALLAQHIHIVSTNTPMDKAIAKEQQVDASSKKIHKRVGYALSLFKWLAGAVSVYYLYKGYKISQS